MSDSGAWLLLLALALDGLWGDPVYRWHPVRLIAQTIRFWEARLRSWGAEGYWGGIALVLATVALVVVTIDASTWAWQQLGTPWAWAWQVFLIWSFLALRDLVQHAARVGQFLAEDDLPGARKAVSWMVGRDTEQLDAAACGRAAVESVAESLCDGVVAPLFWFALLGLPGMACFKAVSTLDSMVGYRTETYRKFGWASARLDDLLCWAPARLTFVLLALVAWAMPGCSARDAWRVGWRAHGQVASPNAGWSQAAMAGALRLKLRGPIWRNGRLSSSDWMGAPDARENVGPTDLVRANRVVWSVAGLIGLVLIGML